MAALTALDLLWSAALLWVAWQVVATPQAFTAVVMFIAFGLLMALAWARLGAVDVALAEAAVGAGVGGALFLGAVRAHPLPVPPRRGPVLALLCAVLGAALALSFWLLLPAAPGLGAQVFAELPRAGVANPVTAVLLNYRGYDTMLELGVLVLAVVVVRQLGPARAPVCEPASASLRWLGARLLPLMVLLAGYLLWAGAYRPGGAFQAGAVLAAAASLWLLVRPAAWRAVGRWPWPWLIALQLQVFIGAALLLLLLEGRLLQYPPAAAGWWILLIEAAASVGIGACLTALYLAGAPERRT